jgi:hypothetical protein
MNQHIQSAIERLKEIEAAVEESFPDGGGPNGDRMKCAVQLYIQERQTQDIDWLVSTIQGMLPS